MSEVIVHVPATTANLGPGFDCLAMALDLWNEVSFSVSGTGIHIEIEGFGKETLHVDGSNLIVQSAQRTFQLLGCESPTGLSILCENQIPLGSGMGSSAAAVLAGVLGANELCGAPLSQVDVLNLAVEIEGHPDNAAAALFGGLVIVGNNGEKLVTRQVGLPRVGGEILQTAVVFPDFKLSTHDARMALPTHVAFTDAIFNIGMNTLVVQALIEGDLVLLGDTMQDRLHQPYRLKLIPGAESAIRIAMVNGAAAAALSGAGPSVIAFGLEDMQLVADAMMNEFHKVGLESQSFCLPVSEVGAWVERVGE
jgi:homoserine kinase